MHAGGHEHAAETVPTSITGVYWTLGQFGRVALAISYYIDSLTLVMFCMVTLIASCIHLYAMGYMHDELHEITDQEVKLRDGSTLRRPGRYFRFFQYLSLFCFSMLGLVLAGNIAMVFVFWELVGICSYFLIGYFFNQPGATAAAKKAFIMNRIGDLGLAFAIFLIWMNYGTVEYDGLFQAIAGATTDPHGSWGRAAIPFLLLPAGAGIWTVARALAGSVFSGGATVGAVRSAGASTRAKKASRSSW